MNGFKRALLLAAACLAAGIDARASGTSVGSGGDPLFLFLETTRSAMAQAIAYAKNDARTRARFCAAAELSAAQSDWCRVYFFEIADQILTLAQGPAPVPFSLTSDPISVVGPNGKPLSVAARTELGPNGAIYFQSDRLRLMSPRDALFLMAHEFQHKTIFRGASPEDDLAYGPFPRGREMIDAAAKSVVEAAAQLGLVGSRFGVVDSFDCSATVGGVTVEMPVVSVREFFSADLSRYRTTLGQPPKKGVAFPESPFSSVVFRFEIEEPNACAEAPSEARALRTQIVRTFRPPPGEPGRADEVLREQTTSGRNPMCPGADPEFSISTEGYLFRCAYAGSEGTTQAAAALPR